MSTEPTRFETENVCVIIKLLIIDYTKIFDF